MTSEDQRNFITQLTNTITGSIISDIDAGRIPEDWDGHELRQLLADRFSNSTVEMGRTRRLEYNNTVLVNNL